MEIDYSLIPDYSEELIKQLEVLYPEKPLSSFDSDRAMWIHEGKRVVVRDLKAKLIHTQEEIAKDKLQ